MVIGERDYTEGLKIVQQLKQISLNKLGGALKKIVSYLKHLERSIRQAIISDVLDRIREIVSIQQAQELRINLPFLSYCTSKLGSQIPIFRHQQPINYLQHKPQELEQLYQTSSNWLLTNTPYPLKAQPYEHQQPTLLIELNWQQIEDKLARCIAALGNQEEGGYILIGSKVQRNRLMAGLSNFTSKDLKKFQTKLNNAVSSIASIGNLPVQVHALPLYQDIASCLKKCYKQFVIRIHVGNSHNFLHLAHHPMKGKPVYEFYQLKTERIASDTVSTSLHYQLERKYSGDIYKLLFNTLMKKIISRNTSRIICKKRSDVQMSLDQFVRDDPIANKKQFFFSNNPNKLLSSCLSIFQKNYADILEEAFPQLQSKQTVIQVQISEKQTVKQVISRIETVLKSHKTPYRVFIPLEQFQEAYNQFMKKESPTAFVYTICYIAFMGSFHAFVERARKELSATFKKDHVLMDLVNDQILLGMTMSRSQLDLVSKSLMQYFTIVPKVKSVQFIQSTEGEMTYKNVQYTFDKSIRAGLMFAYFLFVVAKKRPMSK